MEKLQQDPRTKEQIKDALYDFIYSPVEKSFTQRLNNLILRNAISLCYSHKSFHYKGTFYSMDKGRPPLLRNKLSPQFVPQMEEYLEDLNYLKKTELPYVTGFITQVLNASNGFADYLCILPESVHRPIENMISKCACRSRQLSDEKIKWLQDSNKESINILKQRMMMNLIT